MKKKILIIDDEQDMLEILRYALEAAHFEVVTAMDGVEGMVKAVEEKPNLIILDVMMHNLDGYGFVKEFKWKYDMKHIPIIVLTGMRHLRKHFRDEGIEDYFEKPFQTFELVKRVKELVDSPS